MRRIGDAVIVVQRSVAPARPGPAWPGPVPRPSRDGISRGRAGATRPTTIDQALHLPLVTDSLMIVDQPPRHRQLAH